MIDAARVVVGDRTCDLPALAGGRRGGGFAFGLYKAGSTMLYKALQLVTVNRGVQFVNIVQQFRRAGIVLERESLSPEASAAIRAYTDQPGYVFGGWREFPQKYELPLRGDRKTFLLIRDPRDMITSHYFSLKFSHTTAGAGGVYVKKARESLQSVSIDEFARREAPRVAEEYKKYEALSGTAFMLRRYEDIIFDKLALVGDLCRHFEIDADQAHIARVAQAIDERPASEDVHAHVRQVTPGDHKAKLAGFTIEAIDEVLRDVLLKHGYAA
jgi:hypothetical protein